MLMATKKYSLTRDIILCTFGLCKSNIVGRYSVFLHIGARFYRNQGFIKTQLKLKCS